MKSLQPFVGEWTVEASVAPETVGRTAFEWTLDERFLIQRSEAPDPIPDSFSIVGADGEAFTQHYFDSRGVVRVYAMTFSDGVWTLLRDAPDFSPLAFYQRYIGAFSDDGDTITGRWEQSPDGTSWELDFHLTYSRVKD